MAVPSGLPHARPNWFTSVMGTGIIAVVAVAMGDRLPGGQDIALAAWVASAIGLVLVTAFLLPAIVSGGLARFSDDPHTAPFLGAAPMAGLTVAAATATAAARCAAPFAASPSTRARSVFRS